MHKEPNKNTKIPDRMDGPEEEEECYYTAERGRESSSVQRWWAIERGGENTNEKLSIPLFLYGLASPRKREAEMKAASRIWWMMDSTCFVTLFVFLSFRLKVQKWGKKMQQQLSQRGRFSSFRYIRKMRWFFWNFDFLSLATRREINMNR